VAVLAPSAHAQGGSPGPPSGQPAPPTPKLVVERPANKRLIYEGQPNRQLLGGTWYFRLDDALPPVGESQRWYAQDSLEGWTAITVPYSWNAQDTTVDAGSVGWYRKEFTVPEKLRAGKGVGWKVRFEGANLRTEVWLNGRSIGRFGGYFPFELDLKGLRKGRNTLVAEVSSLRSNHDLTHWRPAALKGFGTGGWWNSGGLLREVYVRRVDTIDVQDVQVLPRLACPRCDAKVEVRAFVRNITRKKRKVDLAFEVGGERYTIDDEDVEPGNTRELDTRFTIKKPKLWEPGHPNLYDLDVTAATDGERRSAYRLKFGVRKLAVKNGIAYINGHRLQLRGASIHEDDRAVGAALSPGVRNLLVGRLRDLHATMTRSHYPLHPAFLEAFDRLGIMYWVDAPVYQLPNTYFDLGGVTSGALRAVRATVRNNMNNVSVMTWALANEPGGNRSELGLIGPSLSNFIEEGAKQAREIDDTRFIAIDRQARIDEPQSFPAFGSLDVIGINEYFGWYDSYKADEARGPSTTQELGPWLDSFRAANPGLPAFITEFGAEASRRGPVEQPGSEEYQAQYVKDHLAIHSSKRWIGGSLVWALRDFRVEPTWTGGAPAAWATPPWHNKSLINEDNGRKLAYFDMRNAWRRTKPLR
jgi:beta-galactosidase/beta-glucuronidase